jgi:Phage tail assembly chaperone protein, TAC
MGIAYGELHWSTDTFWRATLRELLTAKAYITLDDSVNSPEHIPFTDEEKQLLHELKLKVERDERLRHGG